MGEVKIGFVGAGIVNFGRPGAVPWDHASRLEKIAGVKVVAITDVDAEKASLVLQRRREGEFAQIYEHCRIFDSVQRMLESVQLDAVFIGVPPCNRGSLENGRDLELQIISEGIHCFIEKPLSVDEPEKFKQYADAVLKACQSKNILTSVGYMFRYHAAISKMKELILSNGNKVMAFNARYFIPYDTALNKYWWNVNQSGGPIVEQATHFCDLARYLVGDIDLLTIHTLFLSSEDKSGAGRLHKMIPGLEDDVEPHLRHPRVTTTHWRFRGGALGSLMHAIALHGRKYDTEIEVIMDGLRLTLRDPYNPGCKLLIRDGSNDEVLIEYGSDDPYNTELRSFISAVQGGDRSLIRSPYHDAIKTYEFTWAIRRSGKF